METRRHGEVSTNVPRTLRALRDLKAGYVLALVEVLIVLCFGMKCCVGLTPLFIAFLI